ncbi:antibiotic biosynthesis monooxygenase family protein [Solimonas terrae]|uniref:Antibiotic biosynthesis monooxygenase n=1 Tax=Solimonas terrae TaxID=1396819 RepID=A0A6M2BN82_9GAMM|nr:antibiotic biosynthesis monooxygenase [Solimonas terrae]NGY03691.1 antibiotic biosynthesis monooxygenase [Solimonas terrae]
MSTPFATTPATPYYAVIFSSLRSAASAGYEQTAARMLELAAGQDGFLGAESCRGADGFGITVSYWRSEAAIAAWKQQAEHRIARETGRRDWYRHYEIRVAKVERAYGGPPT